MLTEHELSQFGLVRLGRLPGAHGFAESQNGHSISDFHFYDKDLEQVTVKAQKGMLDNTPAMLLSNPAKLDQLYHVKPQGEEGGLFWYELIPRQEGGSFERINLAFRNNHLRIMELQDSFSQTTRLMFKNIKRNPDLDPKLFQFTPPKGVDVIRQ